MPRCAKILIVDDSKVMRTAVRRELGETYEFREAATGDEALTIIRAGFIPELITLDVEMPGLDGMATCERLYSEEFAGVFLHNREGRAPVVFLTARDTPDLRRRGFELGAIDFLSKKFEPGALAALVVRILKPGESLRGVQALIVDDSRLIRQIVGNALREVGVTVLEADNGLEAYTLLCNRMSSIDLVITDIEMPVMKGTDLCRRIRREIGLTELPVVFLTCADQALRLEAFQAGATDCLIKPFLKEEMIARLTVHIEKALLTAQLRRAADELRTNLHRQREMLATLSHDMRSPLSGIIGFANLLLAGQGRIPSEVESIELIEQSGQMLLSMVEDILSLSKQQSGQCDLALQPLALGPLLSRCVALFQGLAQRKRQEIILTNHATETTISGHAESLTRVFNNLLSNAHKFTAEGGRIRITIEPAPPGKIAVVVVDSGIGIDREKIAHLFDRYSRSSRQGTAGEASAGLGMSIAREFVEAHRGEIGVTSVPGEGTQFRVTFPLIVAATKAAWVVSDQPGAESRHVQLGRRVHGRRVLIADDNPINYMIARAILANVGCSVTTVGSGSDALELLLASPSDYDLVLMDRWMPGMDGLAATRALRHAGLIDLPVIALTGSADSADREACLAAGMNGFLTKPFSASALLETILQVCGSQIAQPPSDAADEGRPTMKAGNDRERRNQLSVV